MLAVVGDLGADGFHPRPASEALRGESREARVRIVVALGDNALLGRDAPTTIEAQRDAFRAVARPLAAVGSRHQLLLSHGNGPQARLLALQAAAYSDAPPRSLDVVGAQTEGLIGHLLERELSGVLPREIAVGTVLTTVDVDPQDPEFANPTAFVGPAYAESQARALASQTGWQFKKENGHWRRVVPAPQPRRIFELRPMQCLLDNNIVVICAGGGGVPTANVADGPRLSTGVEAVVDKDLTSELLARGVSAHLLVLATDVDGVYVNWGAPHQHRLDHVTPARLRSLTFEAGSMAPKVEAAVRFVEHTGNRAAIGALADLEKIVEGVAGTQVAPPATP